MFKSLGRVLLSVTLAVGALLPASAQAAGKVVVGGDITNTFNLGPIDFNGLAGNRAFYENLRGGANRVAINSASFSTFATGNLRGFYQFQMNADVAFLDSFTKDSLSGVGLLALVMPNGTFASDQIAAIGGFVREGGRLLLLGEASATNGTFPVVGEPDGLRTNRWLNELLAGIGSSIRLDNNTVGGAGNLVTTDVRSDPLTAGIDQFGYGYVSSVSGGTALFGAPRSPFLESPGENWVFFAAESLGASAVPEPAGWALMICGFGLVGGTIRAGRAGRPVATA